jgi:serine/threonine protein kinase HipA of HipAB toxin-antitoxin module
MSQAIAKLTSITAVIGALESHGLISSRRASLARSLVDAGGPALAAASLRGLYRVDEAEEAYVLTPPAVAT